MHVFELVLGIVAITTVAGLLKNLMAFKSKSSDAIDGIDDRLDKLEELEERIKTLETIITDQNYDLDQKIKSL
jgi:hypothetical protein